MAEAEFLRAMGDALKADESPGRDNGDLHDLRKRSGVRDVRRLQFVTTPKTALAKQAAMPAVNSPASAIIRMSVARLNFAHSIPTRIIAAVDRSASPK